MPAGPIPNVTVERRIASTYCLLRDGLRRDLLVAVAPDDGVEDLADVLAGLERAEHGVDRVAADLVAALDELDQLVDHGAGILDVALVALQGQLVAAQAHGALQALARARRARRR